MRDALGGSVVLTIIVVFMVIVLSYLAFNVNFTKASRMKNKIISTYEEYKGNCNSNCKKAIVAYSKEIGYTVGNKALSCGNKGFGTDVEHLYCIKKVVVEKSNSKKKAKKSGIYGTGYNKVYYQVSTRINIELPIIQNIFDLQTFWIRGDTKTFKIKA